MKIARALEQFVPEPPLFRRARRSRAPRRGRTACSRTACASSPATAIGKDKEAMATFLAGPVMGVPEGACATRCRCCGRVSCCRCAPPRRPRRACLEALPAQLDRVDALLAEGVIGGERPNAADFQIAPSVRLMLCFDQCATTSTRAPPVATPAGSCPIFPAGSGKCSPHMASVLKPPRRRRRLALASRGRDRRRRAGHGSPRCATSACPPTPSASRRPVSPRSLFDYRHFGASAGSRASCSTSGASSRTGGRRSSTPAADGYRARRPVRLLVRRRPRDQLAAEEPG